MLLKGRDALTASEHRIAQLAIEGMTNRQIAQALFITPQDGGDASRAGVS
jgi:DNA-binding CsgD family transcriptional regulator